MRQSKLFYRTKSLLITNKKRFSLKRSNSSGSILSWMFSKHPTDPVNTDNICSHCKKPFNKQLWCEECDPRNIIEGWTSGNLDVDNFIKETMYDARQYDSYFNHFLEWIPFERLANIEQISEGGYFKVYSALWVDGKSTYINKPISRSLRRVSNFKPLVKVALKKLNLPQNDMPTVYLNQLKLHWNVHLKDINNQLKFYGITKDPITEEFLIITEFADKGNLREYLSYKFNNILWKDKISLLLDILTNLIYLHKAGYFHKNLHSGNILIVDGCAHISDFALSGSMSEESDNNKIYGVLPFIASEVLRGEPYSLSSDIYSFGVIMAELSSGKPPYYDKNHDFSLALAICNGLRPKFGFSTPKVYKDLAYRCMSSNPEKRPTADELDNILKFWYRSIKSEQYYQERELWGYKGKEIKAVFKQADVEIPVISTSYRKNPYAVYISRSFEFVNLPKRSIVSYRSSIASNENEISSESKSNSINYYRPSMPVNGDNRDEILTKRKTNSLYYYHSYRPSISDNGDEIREIYISVNQSEILYERSIDSVYIDRPITLNSIDEFEEGNSKPTNLSNVSYINNNEEGTIISPFHNMYTML